MYFVVFSGNACLVGSVLCLTEVTRPVQTVPIKIEQYDTVTLSN